MNTNNFIITVTYFGPNNNNEINFILSITNCAPK